MKDSTRTFGIFVGIFLSLVGLTKIYETIVQTFIPNYGEAFHRYSLDLHVGILMLSAGLTFVWRLRK